MQKLTLFIVFEFFSFHTYCQEKTDINKWKQDFANSTNDSVFVSKYGNKPFQITLKKKTFDNLYPKQDDEKYFNAPVGTVLGAYDYGKNWKFIKIIGFEYSYRMNASHILLKSDKFNEKINKRGEALVKKIKNGQDFGKMAAMNSDDIANRNAGGDLDWFYEGEMIPEFEKAVLQHHIGDVFIVWTEYGLHIIKINHEKVKDKYAVKTVEFYKSKTL